MAKPEPKLRKYDGKDDDAPCHSQEKHQQDNSCDDSGGNEIKKHERRGVGDKDQ